MGCENDSEPIDGVQNVVFYETVVTNPVVIPMLWMNPG
jgi:hypothetical protein